MKRLLLVFAAVLALTLTAGCSGDEGDSPAASSSEATVTKTVVDNRASSSGMRTSFSGGEDELVVGTDIVPGSYRVSGGSGSRCIYVVRDSKGGEVVTGATAVSAEELTVQLDKPGTSVETSSTCSDFLLVSASS